MMKSLLLLFAIFLMVYSRPICCENCGNTLSIESLDFDEEAYENVLTAPPTTPPALPCANRNVCQVKCSTYVPNCSKNVYLDIEFENRIESRAFTEICMEREPKYYQNIPVEDDSIWNRMLVKFQYIDFLKKPLAEGLLKTYQGAYDYFSTNTQYPHSKLIFAVINYVKLQRAFKRVCHNDPNFQKNMVSNIVSTMRIIPSKMQSTQNEIYHGIPKESASDSEKLAFIDKNQKDLQEKGSNELSVWHVKRFIQSIIDSLSVEDQKLWEYASLKMRHIFVYYMTRHSSRTGNYCNCLAFENFSKIDLEELQKNKELYVSERVRENISPFLPKGFINSSVGKQISDRIFNYLTNYQKKILESKKITEEQCKAICK